MVIYDLVCSRWRRRYRTARPTGRIWAAASRRPAARPPGPVRAVNGEPATGSGRLRSCCGPLRDPRRRSPRPPKTLPKRNASSKGPIASLFFAVQARFFWGDVKNNKSMRAALTWEEGGPSGASVEMFPRQKLGQKGHLAGLVGAKGRQFQAHRI